MTPRARVRGNTSENLGWILASLRSHGYAFVRLSTKEHELICELFACSRNFFSRAEKYKESFKFYPIPGGYLTPFPGTYEVFELRRGMMRCPDDLVGQAMGGFRLLEQLALRVSAEIGSDIGVDLASMPDEKSSAMRCIHYDRPHGNRGAADSAEAPVEPPAAGQTVRIVGLGGLDAMLNGAKGTVASSNPDGAVVCLDNVPKAVQSSRGGLACVDVKTANLRIIQPNAAGVYPAHTDSSLVTVAPRSSMPGLEVKDVDTGEWFQIEDRMDPDECLVFVGDPADYASSHRYRALMHRPAVPRGCVQRSVVGDGLVQHRISTPFFLYPRNDAILTPRGLPRLVFDDLNGNVNKCRDNFPWKMESCYYSDLVYSENNGDQQ